MRTTILLLGLIATAALAQDEPAAPAAALPVAAESEATASEATESVAAASAPAARPPDGDREMSGMSILGNEEAPKSLVIVPWKSSRLGDEPGVTNALDERARPLDKDVFMRELRYYEIRAGGAE